MKTSIDSEESSSLSTTNAAATEDIKRCSRCVLTAKTPCIEFDEEGVCNYCREHQSIVYKGEEELLRKLELLKKDMVEIK